MGAPTWTESDAAVVITRWAQGYSAGVIAKELGKTRSAVISKVHRLKLKKRTTLVNTHRRNPPGHKRIRHSVPKAKVRIVHRNPALSALWKLPLKTLTADDIPLAQRKTLMELGERDCRYPYGDPGAPNFFFCGGNAVPGLPYCPDHCRTCYETAAERRSPSIVPRAA